MTPPAVEMPSFRPYLGGLGHLRRRYMLAVFSYSPRQPYLSPIYGDKEHRFKRAKS